MPQEQRDSLRARRLAVLHDLGDEAWGAGEYVGQENFMTAGEVLALAESAGVSEGTTVLDLCCGAGGAALHLAHYTGCRTTGVDRSLEALHIARSRADRREFRYQPAFVAADVCRLPLAESFDIVVLLETMLSIEDKPRLLGEMRRVLRPGGRFILTLEEGAPLTEQERRRLPEGDAVWLVSESWFVSMLEDAGFHVRKIEDHTAAHALVARRLADIIDRDRSRIAGELGGDLATEMLTAHRVWTEWLTSARVRKLAILAQRAE